MIYSFATSDRVSEQPANSHVCVCVCVVRASWHSSSSHRRSHKILFGKHGKIALEIAEQHWIQFIVNEMIKYTIELLLRNIPTTVHRHR